MARILIVFGTTDGQTARIAGYVAEILRGEGHETQLIDTRAEPPQDPMGGIDAAIVAASLRMGKYQRRVAEFVEAHRTLLNDVPSAFLPVSLSAVRSTPAARREVQKTVAAFVERTGWKPDATYPVAGALLYSRYGFFTKIVMRLISKMAGGDTDASRDYEYTDWNAVREFARRFSSALAERAAVKADAPEAS